MHTGPSLQLMVAFREVTSYEVMQLLSIDKTRLLHSVRHKTETVVKLYVCPSGTDTTECVWNLCFPSAEFTKHLGDRHALNATTQQLATTHNHDYTTRKLYQVVAWALGPRSTRGLVQQLAHCHIQNRHKMGRNGEYFNRCFVCLESIRTCSNSVKYVPPDGHSLAFRFH